MRAYFSVAPRFGVSMPWWAAIIAYCVWLVLALMFWFYVGLVCLIIWLGSRVVAMWKARGGG
jgi:hypothetical protein